MLRSACALVRPITFEVAPKRLYRRKILTWPIDYLPFKWTYPEKQNLIRDSGDLVSGVPKPDPNKPVGAFARLPELSSAPEGVQKIFSIEFAPRVEQKKDLREEFVSSVRRHPLDKSSLEYKIASHTFSLRVLKEIYREQPNLSNKALKHSLHCIVHKRNKYLKMLQRQDTERYLFVKEKLQIEHTPFPLGEGHKQLTRKGELRRLTAEWAENLKREKLEAYHDQLKKKQAEFEQEKKEILEFIAKEIEELKLTPEEIADLEYKGIMHSYNMKQSG